MEKESEYITRKTRIDRALRDQGWDFSPFDPGTSNASLNRAAVEEYPTDFGPADYALFVDGLLLGIVEGKKVSVNPQNVMEQAKRYSMGAKPSFKTWGKYRVPFLYSTNGELIYLI